LRKTGCHPVNAGYYVLRRAPAMMRIKQNLGPKKSAVLLFEVVS
jgi:hypothetical protein